MGNGVNEEIGRRLAQARKKKGMTSKELAERIAVAPSTITRYEKGDIAKIKLPVIEAIARVLGVNPMWVLGKSDCETVEAMKASWAGESENNDPTMKAILDNIANNQLVVQINRNALGASEADLQKILDFTAFLKDQNKKKEDD